MTRIGDGMAESIDSGLSEETGFILGLITNEDRLCNRTGPEVLITRTQQMDGVRPPVVSLTGLIRSCHCKKEPTVISNASRERVA